MARHNQLGKWGEKIAVEHLVREGYAICDVNCRLGHYEIDIVAMKGDRLVFVEVKTRSDDFVDPIDAIDRRKINRMVASANAYVRHYDMPHQVQFDIIAIVGVPDDYKLEHIPDAFYAPVRGLR